ncbi:hypothetical protein PINS_up016965 [Pythium insidiosum]|nr:hypothetical protein PINS_up016965 [Pythium insidiosum]
MVLGTGCDRKCFVWRVGTGRVFQTLTGHKGKVLGRRVLDARAERGHHGVLGPLAARLGRRQGPQRAVGQLPLELHDLAMALAASLRARTRTAPCASGTPRSKQPLRELSGCTPTRSRPWSFSRDGNRLLTNSRDNTLQLLDTRTFESVVTLRHDAYHAGFDWAQASLSPDGAYAAAGGANGHVFLWNTISGKLERELSTGHQGAVACCVWRPDGDGLASCDKNGCLVLWD